MHYIIIINVEIKDKDKKRDDTVIFSIAIPTQSYEYNSENKDN